MRRRFVSEDQQLEEAVVDKGDYETSSFEKPDYSFIPNGHHEYRQQGPYLVCKSCELHHGVYIGINKLMTGIDEQGNPILVNRTQI